MSSREKFSGDVITAIECEGEGNFALRIAGSPDTPPRPFDPELDRKGKLQRWNSVRVIDRTTPGGVRVKVAVNFPDLLQDKRLVPAVLEAYDEIRKQGLSGEVFIMTEWKLNPMYYSGGNGSRRSRRGR